MPAPLEQFAKALRLAAPEFGIELNAGRIRKLTEYYERLLKWNPRLHLVAPCSPEEFATRHVLESLMLLRHLPLDARVVDIGSGGGCRSSINDSSTWRVANSSGEHGATR